jgi:hypothetical protein
MKKPQDFRRIKLTAGFVALFAVFSNGAWAGSSATDDTQAAYPWPTESPATVSIGAPGDGGAQREPASVYFVDPNAAAEGTSPQPLHAAVAVAPSAQRAPVDLAAASARHIE